MLTNFFDSADRDVARFCAWFGKLGASGLLVTIAMLFGVYCTLDMVVFITR